MKGTKQLDQIKEDNKKQLKKLFKYDKDNALTFSKEDREKFKINLAYMLSSIKDAYLRWSNRRLFYWLPTYYKKTYSIN